MRGIRDDLERRERGDETNHEQGNAKRSSGEGLLDVNAEEQIAIFRSYLT